MVLWAVDGLAGVVLGAELLGSPRGSGSVPSSPAAPSRRIPRAVMWGQHVDTQHWLSGLPGAV